MRALIAIFFGLFASAALAADDALLAQFVGDWVGKGEVRLARNGEPERILCRITNTLVEGGSALQQKGRCGVASNTGLINGLITAIGGDRYEGTLNSLASRGAATVTGSARNGQLVLTAEFVDAVSGKNAVSTTVLTPRDEGGYHLASTRDLPDGTNYDESQILFAAR